MVKLPETLPPGTIIDFEMFSALVVGDNLLLVFRAEDNYYGVTEGNLLKLNGRGPNDWTIRVYDDDRWEKADFLVSRDWNGRVKCKPFDEYDWDCDWDYDWDCLYENDEYQQIYDDNGW